MLRCSSRFLEVSRIVSPELRIFSDDIRQLVPGRTLTLTNGRLEQVLGEVRLVVRPPLGRVQERENHKEANTPGESIAELPANRPRVRNRHVRQQSLSKEKLNVSYLDHENFLY